MNKKRNFGFLSIILGIILLAINPTYTITGSVIFSGSRSIGLWIYALAVILIFGGSLLIFLSSVEDYVLRNAFRRKAQRYEGRKIRHPEAEKLWDSFKHGNYHFATRTGVNPQTGLNVTRTKRFLRAIKGEDTDAIDNAISKIGTGLGYEEKLTGREAHSIRTSKGGRIIFDYDDSKHTSVTVKDYTPDHKYDKTED